MKTVVLFSFHFYQSRRRAGFHWLCDAFREMGWQARFITVDFSLLSELRKDPRLQAGKAEGINRLSRIAPNLEVGVLKTAFHPVGNRRSLLGRLANAASATYPGFRRGFAARAATGADLVIVESAASLFLVPTIRRVTNAPIVYRVSDNIEAIRPVPALLAAEQRAAAEVDAISLASEILARRFRPIGAVQIDPMGIDKTIFDAATTSPYPDNGRIRVINSGSSGLDAATLMSAARQFPDWDFYQFGKLKQHVDGANIRQMGEVPFAELVPYVKFADIGFAPYLARPGFEYQAEHSNRLLQYVYCGLPSVVPEQITSPGRPHFLGYRSGDAESIAAALGAAHAFDRTRVPRDTVPTWSEVAVRIAATPRRGSRVISD